MEILLRNYEDDVTVTPCQYHHFPTPPDAHHTGTGTTNLHVNIILQFVALDHKKYSFLTLLKQRNLIFFLIPATHAIRKQQFPPDG